jgi:Trypsin-like peptidase domain
MDREAFEKYAPSCVVPVVVVTQEAIRQVGTAFCVSSSGVWITARHVLEGRMSTTEYCEDDPGSYLAILWVSPDEDFRIPIRVTSFTRHPASGSDLAVLWTDTSDLRFPALRLSALVPEKNTSIIGLGYPKFDVISCTNGNTQIEPDLAVVTGKVLEVYKHGRETFKDQDGNFTGKLPTACYETSARFDSHMSGGPVLDSTGSVCGVIAAGFNIDDDLDQDTSFASGTPYIFMLNVAFSPDRQVSIYDLATQGIVLCDHSLEQLRMTAIDEQLWVYYADQ